MTMMNRDMTFHSFFKRSYFGFRMKDHGTMRRFHLSISILRPWSAVWDFPGGYHFS